MANITVVLAESQYLLAEAMGRAVNGEEDLIVLDHRATTGLQAVEAYALHAPDVLVLDYWLPEMNAVAATRQVLDRDPSAKVLVLGWLYGPLQVREVQSSGARAFLSKTGCFDDLIGAIRAVNDGWCAFPNGASKQKLEWAPAPRPGEVVGSDPLTRREIEILQLLCDGHTRHVVISKLGIRPGTLKSHVHNILVKTGCRSLVEAVTMARHEGVVRESGRTGLNPPRT